MSDMRATERLLEFIGEQTDDPKILEAVAELWRRGDTLVRMDDLRLIAAAANHGRKYGPAGGHRLHPASRLRSRASRAPSVACFERLSAKLRFPDRFQIAAAFRPDETRSCI
jgi:hypothetical protein